MLNVGFIKQIMNMQALFISLFNLVTAGYYTPVPIVEYYANFY